MKPHKLFNLITLLGALLLVSAKFSLASNLFAPPKQENFYIKNRIKMAATAATKIICSGKLRCSSPFLAKFYEERNFSLAWSKNEVLLPEAQELVLIITNAYKDGLASEDYHISQINLLFNALKANNNDSLVHNKELADLDLTLSDAFLLYASHLADGRVNSKVFYSNWQLTKQPINLINLLNEALTNNDLPKVLTSLTPHYLGYIKLKEQLSYYQLIAAHGGWVPIPLGTKLYLGLHGQRVALLQQRLLTSGELSFLAKGEEGFFNKNLKQAVIKFQLNHGLPADGVVGSSTLAALNVSVATRIRQIELNMDRLRWLPANLGETYIWVNIPDFSLEVIKNAQEQFSMPIVVGKSQQQSCVLASSINYLELNPYWNVPKSIAIKEFLPKLKQDPTFLNKNDMRLFAGQGDLANEVNPLQIDWTKIESNNFNYQLRQDPGPINALGKIKFMFPNKCGIYLHDTSVPQLFKTPRRDLSHGCIRISKPIELAVYLLQGSKTWDYENLVAAIKEGNRRVILLPKPIKIYIVYATVWVDESNNLQFRNDVYHLDDIPYPNTMPIKVKAVTPN